MNKLLLNNDDEVNTLVIEEDTELVIRLDDIEKYLNIIVEKDVCLNIVEISNNTKNNLSVRLDENSSLIYNKIGKDVNDKVNILLDGAFSNVNLYSSIIGLKKVVCDFNIIHNNINTTSSLFNHGVNSSNNEMLFNVDAKVKFCAKDAVTNQENKIINISSGKSKILPNLLVDNNDVVASHSAYISDFDKESMFYLKSRGIQEQSARDLLMSGFLIGNLKQVEDYKSEIEEFFKL